MTSAHTAAVTIKTAVSLPVEHAFPACERVLEDLRKRPDDAMLSIDLSRDLQAPLEALLSVPIALHVSRASRENELNVRISSANHANLYPTFEGAVCVARARGDSSVITVKGRYSVPLGTVGETVDMTFL